MSFVVGVPSNGGPRLWGLPVPLYGSLWGV